jgi:hypothetical protein
MNSSWWAEAEKQFPDLSMGVPDLSWAAAALAMQALFTPGLVVYTNSLEGVFRSNSYEEVIKKFEECGMRVITHSPPWRGDTVRRIFLVRNDAAASLWFNDGNMEAQVTTTDPELFGYLRDIIEESIGPKASEGRAYVLMATEEGPKLQSIGSAGVPFERGNYNPEVVEDFDAIVADLRSHDPSGRVAVIDGEPGTGKTYLIQGLLDAVPEALFVIVPAGMVPELSTPAMVGALLETRRNKGDLPTVFLIEDGDDCLGSRDASNVNSVSALLNLSDGILGKMLDLRLVCTTNLQGEELDEAVLREGRLSRKTYVGPLKVDVAEAVYRRLTGTETSFRDPKTLAQVYRLAKHAGWKEPETKRAPIGFTSSWSTSDIVDMKVDEGVDITQIDLPED